MLITFKQIYESIILEAMPLEEIWNKYYAKIHSGIIDFNNFVLLAEEIDPTGKPNKKGKYLDWIMKVFKNSNADRFWEDKAKIRQDLEVFDKYQHRIGIQITQIKDYYELAQIVSEFRKKQDAGEIDLSRSEMKKQIEKIFEDSEWLLLTPKTEDAAKYYGKNTRWCTAAEKNNYFNSYNKDGPLYILINKKVPSEKYQFHFQSEQYMNSEDEPITANEFKNFPDTILDKIVELSSKNKKLFPSSVHNPLVNIIDILYDEDEDLIKDSRFYIKYKDQIDNYLYTTNLDKYVNTSDYDKVKEAIDHNPDLTYKNYAALKQSTVEGNLTIFKVLMASDIFKNSTTEFCDALRILLSNIIKYCRLDYLKYLIENKYLLINDNRNNSWYFSRALSELHISNKRDRDILDYLVVQGLDLTKVHSNMDTDTLVLDKLLYKAVLFGYYEEVKYLLKYGANIDSVLTNKSTFNKMQEYIDRAKSNITPKELLHKWADEIKNKV